MDSLALASNSPAETRRLGERMARRLRSGDVILLQGDLGAGKTCLAQGIATGWGVTGPVRSPTFTLIHEYRRPGDRRKLFHVDLYRIANAVEAWALGLDDVWVGGNVCIVEWPERAPVILPAERLWIRLAALDEMRRMLHLEAQGASYQTLLINFRRAAFGR